jgi:hypothetical protein
MADCSNLKSSTDFMTRNIFKSSAKSRNLEEWILAHRSLIKILNNRSPTVEPCGTPDSMGKGEENFPKMRTKENLDDR